MANILYYKITPGIGMDKALSEHLTSGLDAVVLDFDPCFPYDSASAVEELIQRGIPTFIITGQRGQVEQQNARIKEERLVRLGAIPLGATYTAYADPSCLLEGLSEIFDRTDIGLSAKVQEAATRYYFPAIEADEFGQILQFLEDGGPIDLGKFAYFDYSKWIAIKDSKNYKPLTQACSESFTRASPSIVNEMRRLELNDYYSLGPSPNVDKKVLEEFIRTKTRVRYHAIDISSKALFDDKKTIEEYLTTVDPDWRAYVELVDEKPKLFSEVKTDGPCAVAYPGGQIANDNSFLQNATQICQENGIVIADVHRRYDDDDGEFWTYIYDTDVQREMDKNAICSLVRGLDKKENWRIAVRYITREGGPARISFQLETDDEIHASCNMVEIVLKENPSMARETMISKKYKKEEFEAEALRYGYNLIGEETVPVRLPGHIKGRGGVMTAILQYTGKPHERPRSSFEDGQGKAYTSKSNAELVHV